MTLILAFAAGLLTLINPCVLPVLSLKIVGAIQKVPGITRTLTCPVVNI